MQWPANGTERTDMAKATSNGKPAAPKTPKAKEKAMDITSSSVPTPPAGSRPIITGNKKIVKDPMMARLPEEIAMSSSQEATHTAPLIKKEGKRIEPLTAETKIAAKAESQPADKDSTRDEPDADVKDKPPEAVASEPTVEEKEVSAEEVTAEPEAEKEQSEVAASKTAEADSKDESEQENAEKDDKELPSEASVAKEKKIKADDETKRQAAVDALVNSKQYFLPIDAAKKRRSHFIGILLLLLLVLGVAVLAALDAGVLDVGIEAPTDYLSD